MATHPPENLQPHSREAEEALVGAVLKWPDDFDAIDVEPEDFYILRHRMIWQAFRALRSRNREIDELTVSEALRERKQLDDVGGSEYLSELIGCVPFGHNPQGSAEIVRGMAHRRNLLHLASEMAKASYDFQTDIQAKADEFMSRLAAANRMTGGAVHWSKFLSELYDEIDERAKDPKDIYGIQTGFADFDRVTGGLQLGESMILSGKPGVGKSMLAVQMAEQMADSAPGAIYSVEMKGRSVMRRLVSAKASVSTRALKSGRIDEGDWPAITQAIEALESKPVYMSDAAGWTTTSLRADLTRLKASCGVQWFVFDYLLLASDAPGADEIERSAVISRNMKLICRHLDLAGVIIHSMNKEGIAASVPDQQNLRGSGQVSFDADLICFLTEYQQMSPMEAIPKADRDNVRMLFFGKGRELEDPRKYLRLVKRPGYPSFADYAPA